MNKSVVAVTGGANGIGWEICRSFATEGAIVVILDIVEDSGQSAAQLIQNGASDSLYITTDVSDERQVSNAFDLILEQYGGVDTLVNNAATSTIGSILDHGLAIWDRILDVNLKSVYLCSRSALPRMQEKGAGSIINIGSVHSYIARKDYAAYTASKFGVLGLTKAMALDHAPQIRVNAVLPGAVDTQGYRAEVDQLSDSDSYKRQLAVRYPLGRIAQPLDVANAVLFLASEKASSITGSALTVDCGLTAKL